MVGLSPIQHASSLTQTVSSLYLSLSDVPLLYFTESHISRMRTFMSQLNQVLVIMGILYLLVHYTMMTWSRSDSNGRLSRMVA